MSKYFTTYLALPADANTPRTGRGSTPMRRLWFVAGGAIYHCPIQGGVEVHGHRPAVQGALLSGYDKKK